MRAEKENYFFAYGRLRETVESLVSLLKNWTLLLFSRVTHSVTCATFNVTLSHPAAGEFLGFENYLSPKNRSCPRKLEIDAHDPANAFLKG